MRVDKFLELRNFRTAGTRLSYALLTGVNDIDIVLAVLMIVETELTLFEFYAVLGLSCVYYVLVVICRSHRSNRFFLFVWGQFTQCEVIVNWVGLRGRVRKDVAFIEVDVFCCD